MRILLLALCCLFSFSGYSQDTIGKKKTQRFMTINYFRINGIPLTKQDSLNFVFHNGDTLVPIEESFARDPNQVRYPYEPRDEDFLEIYKQVVFGTPEQQEKSTIKIWTEGVRLFFDPSVPEAHQKELLQFAEKVSSGIDSLQITEAQERSNSNFLIFYRNSEDDFDQEERISNSRNAGYYVSWNEKQQIHRGVIKVNAYKVPGEQDQLDLLKYYFFKSLGYFYPSPRIPCEGYLSVCPVKRSITPIDLEILEYHYSYGMCKGINKKSFEEIHSYSKARLQVHPNSEVYLVHSN